MFMKRLGAQKEFELTKVAKELNITISQVIDILICQK